MINLGYKVTTVTLALAVCTSSGKSSIGQANVQAKAVDSRDNRTLTIEKIKVVDNLSIITTTRAKELSKWPR